MSVDGHESFNPNLRAASGIEYRDGIVRRIFQGKGHALVRGDVAGPAGSLATSYIRPQENGNRLHARRLTLSGPAESGPAGCALTVTGYPHVDFTVRRWSPELLTAARHTPDLVPDGRTHVHLDAAHHGIGSASCGPPLPPGHRLAAHTVAYALGFSI